MAHLYHNIKADVSVLDQYMNRFIKVQAENCLAKKFVLICIKNDLTTKMYEGCPESS